MASCTHCGQENPEGAQFCNACGSRLPLQQEPREVRKTVTILFSDVAGSTALGERLDPESLRRVMSRYFDEARVVVERHGGTVEKFIGDAVMAVFGIPTVHEDDALRAVRAAVELRDGLTALNTELEQNYGVTLASRIGVNTGEVVAGTAERLATGDAVNIAARLEQAAPPGEILVGEQTRRLVRDALQVERAGPLTLKGKTGGVEAWRLLAVLEGSPAFERRLDSPLVGRRRERQLLREAFERAVEERSCHLFTILGAAGVGKSRLTLELCDDVRRDAEVLVGRSLPYGEGITYWPLREIFREAGAEDELDSALSHATPEETFASVRKFLESRARERPLALVFDDVQWSEPTFLDFVEHLGDWSRDAAILVVCLARPELLDARPHWGGGKLNATSVLLEPLSDEESAELMANLLGREGSDDDVERRITEAAEGNPLFLEEMVAFLAEDGRDGDVNVPPTIQALLAARLDRLGSSERQVLERASVEGKLFHRGAVAELVLDHDLRADVAMHLMALVRKDLIRPDRSDFDGEDAFRFRHLLLRDAAYQGLPKETRSDLHERFASWLEQAAGARVEDYQEIAGYHLEQAQRYRVELGPRDERAAELARSAAERLAGAAHRAHGRGDMPASVALFERAVALLPEGDPERRRLEVDLGQALMEQGELGRAGEVLAGTAERSAAAADRNAELAARLELAMLALLVERDVRVDVLRSVADEASGEFELLGDDAGLARVWRLRMHLHLMESRFEAVARAAEQSLHFARRAGDRRTETEAQFWRVAAAVFGPTPVGEVRRLCAEVLAEAEGEPVVEAGALVPVALAHALDGDHAAAEASITRAREIYRELGLRVTVNSSAMTVAWVAILAGRPGSVLPDVIQAAEELERMGEIGFYSTVAVAIAELLVEEGRDDEAFAWTERSQETASPEDITSQVMWRMVRARVLGRRGLLDEAERLAREAVHLARRTDDIRTLGDALLDVAEVMRRAGRDDEVSELMSEAIGLYERKGATVSIERARGRFPAIVSRLRKPGVRPRE